MDDNEMQDALEILRSGTLKGKQLIVTDEQMRALKTAIDDLEELRESIPSRQVTPPATNVFFVRG